MEMCTSGTISLIVALIYALWRCACVSVPYRVITDFSLQVPSLFQDNFDYLDIRRDFVHGILTSDLLAKTIHCHVVKDGYAARVRDSKSYSTIRSAPIARLGTISLDFSKDILSRWTYPLVPDENNPSGKMYEHRRGNVYLPPGGTSVKLSRYEVVHSLLDSTQVHFSSCKIGNNTLLGENTLVEENAQVSGSVLGAGCVIGAGAVVRDSYLWDGTTVGEGCTIDQSIIGRSATVLKGSMIDRGCIVGNGVKLGPQAKLPEFSRVAQEEPEEGGGAW